MKSRKERRTATTNRESETFSTGSIIDPVSETLEKRDFAENIKTAVLASKISVPLPASIIGRLSTVREE